MIKHSSRPWCSIRRLQLPDCGDTFPNGAVRTEFEATGSPPYFRSCGLSANAGELKYFGFSPIVRPFPLQLQHGRNGDAIANVRWLLR